MNEANEEPLTKKRSLRKRLGKALFWIGLIIIVVSFIPIILGFVGGPSTEYGYGSILNLIGPGIILAIIGLLAVLYSENESYEEPLVKKKSRIKRLGKALFWIGLIIIVVSFITTILGFALPATMPDGSIINWVGIGLVLTILGFFAFLFPDGQGEDGNWVMMMSPFAGSN